MLITLKNGETRDIDKLNDFLRITEETYGYDFNKAFMKQIEEYAGEREEFLLDRDDAIREAEMINDEYRSAIIDAKNLLQETLNNIENKRIPFSRQKILPILKEILDMIDY